MTSRPSWDEYFLSKATVTATRSSCPRAAVGCVIVDAHHYEVSSGYNGAPSGLPDCNEVGCEMEHSHCKRTNHAEINAIIHAARKGGCTINTTAYITHEPCYDCTRALISAGVERIVFKTARHGNAAIWRLCNQGDVTLEGPTGEKHDSSK